MELWSPPHDAPHLLEWWRPLILVGRRAWAERFPWPVHVDEFRLAGRVDRRGRPDVWIYEHHANGGSLCVDGAGGTYRFVATPRGRAIGQFRPCPVRTALWRARLPDVVEPIWYEGSTCHPASGAGDDGGGGGSGGGGARRAAGDGAGPDGPVPVRRGHLTLVSGLAG
jgi:hypothetical protein